MKRKNKIIFDKEDDDNLANSDENNIQENGNSKKKTIFDEEDESDKEYNFEVKEQFKGQNGQKVNQQL